MRSRCEKPVLSGRSVELVSAPDTAAWDAEIVITVAHHDQSVSLTHALKSALSQTVVESGRAAVLVLDDSSSPDWIHSVSSQLAHVSVILISARCGSAARARNCLLDYVDNHFSQARWVARLDADDSFASARSVEALCNNGDSDGSLFVIGSNNLLQYGKLMEEANLADSTVLKDRDLLKDYIVNFCEGRTSFELPSCNLVLSTHLGVRYPNIKSAEDHWLVAMLLMFRTEHASVVREPIYANYSINGRTTRQNLSSADWKEQRMRLAEAAVHWHQATNTSERFLGAGQEGVVCREGNYIVKKFYSWALSNEDALGLAYLEGLNANCLPSVSFYKLDGSWHCRYPDEDLRPLKGPCSLGIVKEYLRELYTLGLTTNNVKRDNLKLNAKSGLVYTDIGKDITPLTSSKFLDMCARVYSVCVLDNADEEWVRRPSTIPQDEALHQLSGFAEFYLSVIEEHHPLVLTSVHDNSEKSECRSVSLLVKACAQDWAFLNEQMIHIVTQLSQPVGFAEVILLIDSYEGPFLRQYAEPDLQSTLDIAKDLKRQGVVDRHLTGPLDNSSIKSVYAQWFGNSDIRKTHTTTGAPLFSQLWGFEQISTRYVLQCDIDVLVGRKDYQHDFLADMLFALQRQDVLGVGFNIPKANDGFREYEAPVDGYVPEVRFGLLDLQRIRKLQPINNPVSGDRFTKAWHRALERAQQVHGYRSLRGGDSRSFYIHPKNEDKNPERLHAIRNIVANGTYPRSQAECFDLVEDAEWQYPVRRESIVLLLKGRNTPEPLLRRCVHSLTAQTDQEFGVIFIDDASDAVSRLNHPQILTPLLSRLTVINRQKRAGRIPNFIQAIEDVCIVPDTLIVVVDQDDALMRDDVIASLRQALATGADLIQMPMFRPNKPTKLYQPEYTDVRKCHGNNVWSHLRAFKKKLFERVPKSYFQINAEWVEETTDYATMVPMAELATKPVYLDQGYAYYHQRNDYSETRKLRQKETLAAILSQPPLVK